MKFPFKVKLKPKMLAGLLAGAVLLLKGKKKAPKPKGKKGTPKANVIQWVGILQDAHAKYPNVPISLACAIMENESGGDFDAVRYECKNHPKTGKNFGTKGPCPEGHQRYDKQGRPVMSTGAWQFLIATGESYGLSATENASADERRDPRKATMAAFKFLSSLIEKFKNKGGEPYAISAYNAGAGAALKAYKNGTLPNDGSYYKHIQTKREKYRYLD